MRNVKAPRSGQRRSRPRVEGLESRQLLSAVVTNEYPVANTGIAPPQPAGIVAGPNGEVWFLENSPFVDSEGGITAGYIGEMDTWTGNDNEFAIPVEFPALEAAASPGSTGGSTVNPQSYKLNGITVGSDGNLWFGFSGPGWSGLGSFNPTTLATREYPGAPGSVGGVTATPGGNIWYTDQAKGAIGVFNLATFSSTEFPLPQSTSQPTAITLGPDGNLWFVETAASKVGMINPTTHAITEFATPTANSNPTSIAAGFDGNLWFTEQGAPGASGSLGVVNLSSGDAITEIPLAANTYPMALTAGPDGNLYFTELTNNGRNYLDRIASVNPRTHGIVESDIPAFNTLIGIIDKVSGPSELSYPLSPLALGPDGNVWIEDQGRIDQAAVIASPNGAITSNVYKAFNFNNTVFTNPLGGRTVYIDLVGDGKLESGDPTAVTSANGQYVFKSLFPGTYTVRLLTNPGDVLIGPAGSSETVTVTAGGVAEPATIGVLPSSSILPLTVTSNPFGTNNPDLATAEVNGLYTTILGRAPDASGGPAAIAYLRGGGTLETLAKDLLGSIEYDSDVVASYYKNFLGRAGSTAEINAWVPLMQGGLLQEQMAAKFFNSTEYNQLHATDSDFIQSLYTNILGRPGSTSEVSAWKSAISGGTARAQVVQTFLSSNEAATRAAEGFDAAFGRISGTVDDSLEILDLTYGNPQLIDAIDHAISTDFANRAAATVKIPLPPQEA